MIDEATVIAAMAAVETETRQRANGMAANNADRKRKKSTEPHRDGEGSGRSKSQAIIESLAPQIALRGQMLTNLLLYRMTIVNLVWAGLIVLAWHKGWVTEVMSGDTTGLVYVMAGLFVVSIVSTFIRAGKVTSMLNRTKAPGYQPQPINRAKFLAKQAHLDDIPNWLVTLGLLGTVIGVSMSIFGIDHDALGSADGVKSISAGLIQGIQVALYTTIVGSVLALWASVNRRILRTATLLMLEDAGAR